MRSHVSNKRDEGSIFHNMDDARRFLRNITSMPNNEINLAIGLMLFIPHQQDILLNAQWTDIDFSSQWIIKSRKATTNGSGRDSVPIVIELSFIAVNWLNALRNHTGNHAALFPNLSAMKKSERDAEIIRAIKYVWPNYPIDVKKFKLFFVEIAKKYGYFHPSFITEVIHNRRKPSRLDPSWSFHRRALVNWWGYELIHMMNMAPYAINLNF